MASAVEMRRFTSLLHILRNPVVQLVVGTAICHIVLIFFAIFAPQNPLFNHITGPLIYAFFFIFALRGALKRGIKQVLEDVGEVLTAVGRTLIPLAFIVILGIVISHTLLFSAPLLDVVMIFMLEFFLTLFCAVLASVSLYVFAKSIHKITIARRFTA
jgi:hypothetical protein